MRKAKPIPDPDHPGRFLRNATKAKTSRSRAIADLSWEESSRRLADKTSWMGGTVASASRFFASTKTCSSRRWEREEMRLEDRTFVCQNIECELVIDRDLNTAINLATWAEKDEPSARLQTVKHVAGRTILVEGTALAVT